jgi:Xaa-Pro dipeptidase
MRSWNSELPFGLPFEREEYQTRLAAVRSAMGAAGLDLLVVSSPENIYYLTAYRTTGYYVYQVFLLPREGEGWFVTSELEHTNVEALSWIKNGFSVGMRDDNVELTMRAAERCGARDAARIGYEERGFWLTPQVLDQFRARFAGAELVPAGHILEHTRAVKSPAEIACIREAARIASVGVKAGIAAVRPGVTENAIAGTVYKALTEEGGEYPAGQPYVVTGRRGALAHMTPERYRIERGECVYFEIGGSYKRYSGSIMRMVSVGPPSTEARALSEAVLAALEAVIAAIGPGAVSQDVDRAGRAVIEDAGYGDYFHHRVGYSMGVAFPPGWGEGLVMDIADGNERRLEPGMVFHCVPLVVIPEFGCMGFSETILVTEDGNEVLTAAPRELVVR